MSFPGLLFITLQTKHLHNPRKEVFYINVCLRGLALYIYMLILCPIYENSTCSRGGFRGGEGPPPPLSSGNHSEKGKILLCANCKIKHFAFIECRKCHFRDSRCSKCVGGHAPGPPPGSGGMPPEHGPHGPGACPPLGLGLRPRTTATRPTGPPFPKSWIRPCVELSQEAPPEAGTIRTTMTYHHEWPCSAPADNAAQNTLEWRSGQNTTP